MRSLYWINQLGPECLCKRDLGEIWQHTLETEARSEHDVKMLGIQNHVATDKQEQQPPEVGRGREWILSSRLYGESGPDLRPLFNTSAP